MNEKLYCVFKVIIFISTFFLSALTGFSVEGPIWTSWVGTYHFSNIDGMPTGSIFFETHWSLRSRANSDVFRLDPERILSGGTGSYYGPQGTAYYPTSSGNEKSSGLNPVFLLPRGSCYYETQLLTFGEWNDCSTITEHLLLPLTNLCILETQCNPRHLNFGYLLFKTIGTGLNESVDNQKFVIEDEYNGDSKIILWSSLYHWILYDNIDDTYTSNVNISEADVNNFSKNPGYPLPGGGYYFEPHLIMNGHNDGSTITTSLLPTPNSYCYLGTPFDHRHSNSECLLFKTNSSSGIKNADNKKFLIGINYTGDLKFISWYPGHHPVFGNNNDNTNDIYDSAFIIISYGSGNNVKLDPGDLFPRYPSYIEPQWTGWADTYAYSFNPVQQSLKIPIYSLGASSGTHYWHLDQKWTHSNNTCRMVLTDRMDNLKFVKGGENANNLKFIEPIMVKKDREYFNEIAIT